MNSETFQSSILKDLAWRDRVEQLTHPELDELLDKEQLTLYAGFDPTADSLHIGNLVPMMGLAFFLRHGHSPMALVGGATGRIGDPSGKAEERLLLSKEILEHNLEGISKQLEVVLERAVSMHPETRGEKTAKASIQLVNNYDWMMPWSYIDFLRDVGKHFRVNNMIAKDSVKTRLNEREQGISYTEFSYMLIQAYDFLHLFREHGCRLQIGGSDQWGNITAGVDLIRRKLGTAAYGVVFPLLTSSTGQKFGKSEKGAVWLDPERSTPYEFFQYWVQRDDADLGMLLKTFTFLSKEEVDSLTQEVSTGRNHGQVQKRLAHEVTSLVHGVTEADKAEAVSRMLFGERIEGLSDRDLQSIFVDVPSTELSREQFTTTGMGILDLFAVTKCSQSKGEARRLIKQGGGYLNNVRIGDPNRLVTESDLASESMLVLRAGKKKYHLVRLK